MAEKHNLQIHCTRVFHPKPLGVTHSALGVNGEVFAAVRKLYYKDDKENLVVRFIEIYRMEPKLVLVQSLVEYEQITGIGWLTKDLLMTVSSEQTINIYSTKTGQKIFSTITDYGPITSMKLCLELNLLLTGTEYGYVAAYRVDEKHKSIEPISKMVKLNGPINFLDSNFTPKTQTKSARVVPNKPTKRKRTATSDGESESEDDEDGDSPGEFLDESEILIFGASGGDVVVWNYHKRTIIDTVHIGDETVSVNVLLALASGEVVVGDSSGTVSVLDTNTFTCRYSTNVLESGGVLCLTKNSNESSLLVSGHDSSIIIMKRDKSNGEEYRLKEKIEAHTNEITSLSYLSKGRFLSASLEGFLTLYKRAQDNRLERNMIGPNYSDKVTFFNGEMMCQNHKSLQIWGLSKKNDDDPNNHSDPAQLSDLKPTKVLTIKAKNYIQSCVFNDKHLAYSNLHGLFVFQRNSSNEKPTLLHADQSLSKCTRLKICDNYLIACSNNNLTVIQLDTEDNEHEDGGTCKIVATHCLKSMVQQLVYMATTRQLIVACGPTKNLIYRLDLNPADESSSDAFGILDKISLSSDDRISSMVVFGECEKYVYILTDSDKILKVNVKTTMNESKIQKRLAGKSRVQGLPKDAHLAGLIILTKDHGILYGSNCMYKLDINSNEIVNHSSNYNQIVTMDNRAFEDPLIVALAELSPDDYRIGLPSFAPPRRRPFGFP